ncbi:MAG: tetratricopeptide repeat protein [Cyclobacteriaceae bacterium]|nr:tetratricopeptide repeat protein [Cyclobacteriaceae bacterium]UYN86308.1 MAG: tetratricopeptide repeat protein [Cyclobacteriaceae bacterium]
MIFFPRLFLVMLGIGLIPVSAVQAQETIPLTAWYRNLLLPADDVPLEKHLKAKQDELLEAKEIQDDSARIFIQLEMGMLQAMQAYKYEEAMDLFLKALTLADSAAIANGQVYAYLALAHVFNETSNIEKSLQFLERARDVSLTIKDPDNLALVLNALGKAYAAAGQHDEAFESFEEALQLKDRLQQPDLEAEALSNTAQLYALQKDYSNAIDYYKQALSVRRKHRMRMAEGMLLNEIGSVYERMNNAERAYANYKAALEVFQSIDVKKGIAEAYNNIGLYYYRQKNYKQALPNFELALQAAQSAQTKAALRTSYDYLSLTCKALGDFKRALTYRELFLAMNEFMAKEESDQKLLEAQSLYALVKKEQEIEKLELAKRDRERELAEQKRVQQYLFLLIGLGVVIIMLTLYLYLLKRRSNQQLKQINETIERQNVQLQQLNATKDKFFSIIGHDIKGPLNSLTSFSNLLINHFEALSKEDIQTVAKDLDKSLKNLFTLLNNLLEWARSQTGNIDFKPAVFDITEVLQQNKELLQAQAAVKEIAILYERGVPIQVLANQQSINTVVRNLVSNAIKFTPSHGAIKLAAEQRGNEVIVSVADTGVGMNKNVLEKLFRLDAKHSTPGTANEKGTGLGLILCKDFVEKNSGKLWVESEEGRGSVFSFSINKYQGSGKDN